MRLVVICPGNIYRIYEGRRFLAAFVAADKLTRREVEVLHVSSIETI